MGGGGMGNNEVNMLPETNIHPYILKHILNVANKKNPGLKVSPIMQKFLRFTSSPEIFFFSSFHNP